MTNPAFAYYTQPQNPANYFANPNHIPEGNYQVEYEALLSQLRGNRDEDTTEWALAAKKLRKKIDEHFESKLQARVKAIEELNQRLDTLQAQLETRVDSKQEIIELKLQTLLNEARGLGF